jgi:hypothetical protein
LLKRLPISLSEKENLELNRYLTSNSNAKLYFNEIKKIWDLAINLASSDIYKTDVSEEWMKFIQNLKSKKIIKNEK